MVKKILMLVLPLVAFIGGAFGGDMLRGGAKADAAANPEHAAEAGTGAEADAPPVQAAPATTDPATAQDLAWFGFANQFFVPIVRNGSTDSMMILTVSLEVTAPSQPKVAGMEARLRDALLRTLMIHANTG
ncbi:MAG: hypothetical protein Q4G49_09585, partial [Paracoccus sp. (in: a-proteobacteria)]|nr:hypothetical protein [Paracoccus sp. (in: a-proteobacteria)]